jgi:hypothetical protein
VLLDVSDSVTEDRFARELALTLGALTVVAGPPELLDLPLSNQLALLRPIVGPAKAVIWLDERSPQRLVVSVAVLEPQRSVIRVVEADRGDGAEVALATEVRELLTSLYSDPVPEPEADPPARVVSGDTPVVPVAEPPGSSPRADELGVGLTQAVAGGARAGVRLGSAWRLGTDLSLGPTVDIEVGGTGLWWTPALELQGRFWTLGVEASGVHQPWGFQLRPGLRAGLQHVRPAGLRLQMLVAVLPRRDLVQDGAETVYDSGWVELGTRVSWIHRAAR